MSKRTERRAAERDSRKLAYHPTLRQEPEPSEISAAQLPANRANAQFSTGPATQEGRAKSAMNAPKHCLTGKAVVLPHEDATQYQKDLDTCIEIHKPVAEEELRLVHSLVDCAWRLNRIQRLETAILLKGHIEFANKFEDHTPIERAHLIEAKAYLKYEKQLRNLNIQEARLRRVIEKDRAELLRLQGLRRREEQSAASQGQPTAEPQNGFEFSTPPSAASDNLPPQPLHQTPNQAAWGGTD